MMKIRGKTTTLAVV